MLALLIMANAASFAGSLTTTSEGPRGNRHVIGLGQIVEFPLERPVDVQSIRASLVKCLQLNVALLMLSVFIVILHCKLLVFCRTLWPTKLFNVCFKC